MVGVNRASNSFHALPVAMPNIQPLRRTQSDRRTTALDVGIRPAGPGLLQQANSLTDAPFLECFVQLFQKVTEIIVRF